MLDWSNVTTVNMVLMVFSAVIDIGLFNTGVLELQIYVTLEITLLVLIIQNFAVIEHTGESTTFPVTSLVN